MEKKIETKEVNETKKVSTIEGIFEKAKNSSHGLLKTTLGKTNDIYRNSLFEGMSDKEKKSNRKKIRNLTESYLDSFLNETDKDKLQKMYVSFKEYYESVYKINDYSLSSICSENLKQEKKDKFLKSLSIIKTLVK